MYMKGKINIRKEEFVGPSSSAKFNYYEPLELAVLLQMHVLKQLNQFYSVQKIIIIVIQEILKSGLFDFPSEEKSRINQSYSLVNFYIWAYLRHVILH
jgi:hypothetical protein